MRSRWSGKSGPPALQLTGIVGDAEFGDVTVVRTALHRRRLPYTLGISSDLTVFVARPRVVPPPAAGAPWTRGRVVGGAVPVHEAARPMAPLGVALDQLAQRHAAPAARRNSPPSA